MHETRDQIKLNSVQVLPLPNAHVDPPQNG